MRNSTLLAALIVAGAVSGAPQFVAAMENSNPAAPQTNQSSGITTTKHKTKKPKSGKNSSLQEFFTGYHTAYNLIYEKSDYEGGIKALRAMDYDNNPDVATMIGYASRKLGRYDDAKYWYDKALAADPNHATTWSYYGMWHAEQGNILKAKDDLEKVHQICGNTECREYVALKDVIDGTKTY